MLEASQFNIYIFFVSFILNHSSLLVFVLLENYYNSDFFKCLLEKPADLKSLKSGFCVLFGFVSAGLQRRLL